MPLESFVINTATIVTLICFITGIEICYKIWKKRSTKDISQTPFQFGFIKFFLNLSYHHVNLFSSLISCTLWMYYGILTDNDLIINTNCLGFVIFLFYNLFYYYMCSQRHAITKQYLIMILSLYLLWNAQNYFKEPVKIIGLFASSFNIAFFASPLTQINVVLKTKNSESLPLPLIFVSFISSSLWFTYGIIIDDSYIKIPNILAILILGLQLVLYFVYYKNPTSYAYSKLRVDGI